MSVVSFECTKDEMLLIQRIVKRFRSESESHRLWPSGLMELEMDITAVHCNGCPLDLSKLLAAPAFDFAHDIRGIQSHINRATGCLEDFFLPRCARPQR